MRAALTDRRPARLRLARRDRRLPMFWWLGLSCALIGAMAAILTYTVTRIASARSFDASDREQAVGRTQIVKDRIEKEPDLEAVRRYVSDGGVASRDLHVWVLGTTGAPLTDDPSGGIRLASVPEVPDAVTQALDPANGLVLRRLDQGRVQLVAVPVRINGLGADLPPPEQAAGGRAVLLTVSARPRLAQAGRDILSGVGLTALVVAAAAATLAGFALAAFLTSRVRRLSEEARAIADGRLDPPDHQAGLGPVRDELTGLADELGRMRERLRDSFRRLEDERGLLETVLGSLAEGVLLADADGAIAYSNRSAQRILGRGDRVPPTLWRSVTQPSRPPDSAGGAGRAFEIKHLARILGVSARPLDPSPAGEGVRLIVVSDRTDQLLRQRAERDFVANAAHEMRNPVAAIRAATEALQAGAKDDPVARERFLGALGHESERLGRLLRALLMLARAEAAAGTAASDTQVVAVGPLLDVVATGIDGVVVDCDPPDLTAHCEPEMLEQALSALLANAHRHARTRVSLSATPDGGGAAVAITVSDDGDGIPAAERAHVFERFYRGSNAAGEGAGLGLSIARRLIAAQGGTIGLADPPEGESGARFVVRLPAGAPADVPAPRPVGAGRVG